MSIEMPRVADLGFPRQGCQSLSLGSKPIIADRKRKGIFSQVFVHNRPHGYSFTASSCYGAVGTHPTGMLSCLTRFLSKNV